MNRLVCGMVVDEDIYNKYNFDKETGRRRKYTLCGQERSLDAVEFYAGSADYEKESPELVSALSGFAIIGATYFGLDQLTGHLEEIASATGHSTDQARRLEERYSGLSGKVTALKDGVDILKNGLERVYLKRTEKV